MGSHHRAKIVENAVDGFGVQTANPTPDRLDAGATGCDHPEVQGWGLKWHFVRREAPLFRPRVLNVDLDSVRRRR